VTSTHPTPSVDPRRLFKGRRVSAARAKIAEASTTLPGAFTVEDLHGAVTKDAPGVGLATVYRAAAAMVESGSLAPVGTRDGRTLYALCPGGTHHHHLVCTVCGAVVGVDCPFEHALDDAAAHEGYTVTRHEVTLYGLCRTCTKKRD